MDAERSGAPGCATGMASTAVGQLLSRVSDVLGGLLVDSSNSEDSDSPSWMCGFETNLFKGHATYTGPLCPRGSARSPLHWADGNSPSTNTILPHYKYMSLTNSVKQKHRDQGNQDMLSPARMQLLIQLQLCTSGRYCYSDAQVSKIMKFFDN